MLKYSINKELLEITKQKAPSNIKLYPLISFAMKYMFKCKTDDDVDVTLRENEAIFKIKVNISKDVNKDEIETKIKEVLTNNLLYLLDAVPFKIVIKTNII